MQTVYVKSFVEEVEGKKVVAVATDFSEDRDGERIDPDGIDVKNFKLNPIMLFGHDHRSLPIGVAKGLKRDGKRWVFEPELSEATQWSRDVKALYDEGVLKAFSIGFIPQEMEGNVFTKSELLEISLVNVPSNPKALVEAKAKGLNLEVLKETGSPQLKTVDSVWDRDSAVERMKSLSGTDKENLNWAKYAQGFAYVDQSDLKNFSSYKLPFADVIDGELKAVWGGVQDSMSALLAAKAGLDLPDSSRREAYGLLKVYYKAFGKEAPEFKSFESVSQVIDAHRKGHLRPEHAIDLIDALHPEKPEEKQNTDDDQVESEVSHVEKLISAVQLASQTISTLSNGINHKLNTYKDGKRK